MPDPELFASRIELSAAPAAVRCARRWAAGRLAPAGPADLVDTAVLLVSELVTNAVHASCAASCAAAHDGECADPGRIELSITRTSDTVRIEVADCAAGSLPTLAGHASDREGGRGMQVIDALSQRWGCHCAQHWKVVWCELPTADQAP
jgi:anti-sigma regulatory factor (Ser/Thr protein kinase)